MGFLDNVRDAFREAVSPRSKQGKATPAPDAVAVEPQVRAGVQSGVREPEQRFDSYTIQVGDTLDEVGARFGSTAAELARINEIDPDLIFPDQVLRIPSS